MKDGPLKPGTLNRIHVVLRSAFSQAMRWGWVWSNPAERAHRIVVPPPELHPPTPAELQHPLQLPGTSVGHGRRPVSFLSGLGYPAARA